jgi:hypothetical protein
MKALKLLFVISILVLTSNCEKIFQNDRDIIWVYKTKNDYTDKVSVQLSEDKSEIKSLPAPSDVDTTGSRPLHLVEGYYLNGSSGPNTGYLSLTKKEYSKYEVAPSRDSMYSLLIDKDPFIRFYSRDDDNGFRDVNVSPYGIDTAKINDLIRRGTLSNHFTRLK